MNGNKIHEAIAKCQAIINNSTNCAAEIDLLLGALARHSDWTDQDIADLQRRLVLDMAHQLCVRR